MRVSLERLLETADATGFRPEMLEKVIQLLHLLQAIQEHPFLTGKLVLKGGTALNLFNFDIPRLSVDIDLNYVSEAEREAMLADRPLVEGAIQAVCSREGFAVTRVPYEHAGGKWRLRYESAYGQGANLELDLNYMFRGPLWPVAGMDSRSLGPYLATRIPVLDMYELAAGKLAALFSRRQARDLFDSHKLMTGGNLEPERLRTAFVVYGGMNRRDWREVALEDIAFDEREVAQQLVPTLRAGAMRSGETVIDFGRRLVTECQEQLSVLLPFTDNEKRFLDRLLDDGIIDVGLLTEDSGLQRKIERHPMLAWKAQNVRQHKGKASEPGNA
jgi:predicted nucleotidyltransferase component of viral defense system